MSRYPIKFYFELFWLHLRKNGVLWTVAFSFRHAFHETLVLINKFMVFLERKFDLPGSNTAEENALKWNRYRWTEGENEWTESEQWKNSVIEHVLLANIPEGKRILEIGPGFARWTNTLVDLASHLTLVDVAEKCIEHCKVLFSTRQNIDYFVNDGNSLGFLEDNSIDYIWSFDVFVHIEPEDVRGYLDEFRRVLVDEGLIIIHHGIAGRVNETWRSTLTGEIFAELLGETKFELVKQFSAWGPNDAYSVASTDAVSIFKKL